MLGPQVAVPVDDAALVYARNQDIRAPRQKSTLDLIDKLHGPNRHTESRIE
jgi:hypothetical protein